MFKCVCGERHSVPDRYDNKDYVCLNGDSRRNQKTFQNMAPEDLFTRNRPLWNQFSTKVDEARPVTMILNGPDFRASGERITSRKKTNW